MRPFLKPLAFAFTLVASPALSASAPVVRDIVEGHILPGFEALAASSAALDQTAQSHCAPTDPALRAAFNTAFDAWVRVSHLRFGPTEQGDRGFALAFWPDKRGKTPNALAALIAAQDPSVATAEGMASQSVAARGFYALERLLYDPQYVETADATYLCSLLQGLSGDIAATARAIHDDWAGGYGMLLLLAGNDSFRDPREAGQKLLTSLLTGIEFTADMRLGRPLGTFDKPRSKRAEAWRSGRSLRHVILSLEATRDMAARLSGGDDALDRQFQRALDRAKALAADPVFAGVTDPQSRFGIEALQQAIRDIDETIATDMAPRLGIAPGFNSLDGD